MTVEWCWNCKSEQQTVINVMAGMHLCLGCRTPLFDHLGKAIPQPESTARRAPKQSGMVRLHKVRAGRYETTPEPEDGTLVAISTRSNYYRSTWWEILRYEVSPVDGGLDLISTGDIFGTLREARYFITNHHNEGAVA